MILPVKNIEINSPMLLEIPTREPTLHSLEIVLLLVGRQVLDQDLLLLPLSLFYVRGDPGRIIGGFPEVHIYDFPVRIDCVVYEKEPDVVVNPVSPEDLVDVGRGVEVTANLSGRGLRDHVFERTFYLVLREAEPGHRFRPCEYVTQDRIPCGQPENVRNAVLPDGGGLYERHVFVRHLCYLRAPPTHETTAAIQAVRDLHHTTIANVVDGILPTDSDERATFLRIEGVACQGQLQLRFDLFCHVLHTFLITRAGLLRQLRD